MRKWLVPDTNVRHKVFIRMLIPYLLFICMLLGIGYIVYRETIHVMEKDATENHRLVLEQSRDILERRMDEIISMGRQVAANTKVIQFMTVTDPFQGANTYSVLDTNKSLYDFKLSNNFVYNYYILFKNSDLVLTPGSSYTMDEFFSRIAVYEGGDTEKMRKAWMQTYHSRSFLPSEQMSIGNSSYQMMTYLQSLGLPSNPQAVIAVMIDQAEIRKLFQGLNLTEGGWAYILDDQGRIMSTLSGENTGLPIQLADLKEDHGIVEQKMNNQSIIITYTKSSVNGWTYIVGQPKVILLGKVHYIQKIIFTLTLLFLVIGVSMAYFLAYRNSKPLRNLAQSLKDLVGGGVKQHDVYGFISEAVSGLAISNRKLQSELELQVPLLRASYFRRLMQGQFLSTRDADILLKHLGLGMEDEDRQYVVGLIRIQGYDNGYNERLLKDLDRVRFASAELIRELVGSDGFAYDVAQDQIAVLLSVYSHDANKHRENITRIMEQVCQTMNLRFQIVSDCGIGGFCDRVTTISRSYEQAREALFALVRSDKDGLQWFDELPAALNDYHYPQDMEGRLMNVALAGEQDEVARLLQALYAENFENRHLSITVLRLFISELWGNLVKLLRQLGMQAEEVYIQIQRIDGAEISYESLQQHFAAVRLAYSKICQHVIEQRSSRNIELLDNIRMLLQQDFADKALCLDEAADRLRVSKVYLSQFFKDQTGINFSDYLEQLRMEQAKHLLRNSSYAIQEIADQVGYSSSNTFCRAFKRLHGVSATVYQRSVEVNL
ncbi:helix-turn-helix domain-containing protein [Paenibacillus sp. 5J-6]|uniref:Helix-turn-helix domain-containing protein n=1 Tax=Paenibacillus silvestris TaxID=2606219 RepID=A0A6L8UUA5_9BACL|nr:helix-turn-helix domain-containing protein [Paenibacillus silvestris]MZQ81447.1 helix-turn-helix domain-containing protein [Paenibacillus silvestris]